MTDGRLPVVSARWGPLTELEFHALAHFNAGTLNAQIAYSTAYRALMADLQAKYDDWLFDQAHDVTDD